jgi:adenylate cyclase, class 2
MIEFEGKILDVDPEVVDLRILNAGGKYLGETLQRRYVFDIDAGDRSRWIRLRDNGSSVTLATKHIRHDGLDGTDEYEVTVGDFDDTLRLVESMGFTAKAYQENSRSSYALNGAQLEVDCWPRIPAYLEIEGTSRAHVVAVSGLLGYSEDQLTGMNTTKVYAHYGIDLSAITDLRF